MIILRTELKYVIPIKIYPELRKRLIPFVKKDTHIKRGKRTYPVYSVYFDTMNLTSYEEKVEGVEFRQKFRIRHYGAQKDLPNTPIFIELKQRRGPIIKKLRMRMLYSDWQRFEQTGELINNQKNSAIFEHFFLQNPTPVTRVIYNREALIGLYEHNTRITFDFNITGEQTRTFNFNDAKGKSLLISPLAAVLEIKTPDQMPTWLSHIIDEFSLELVAFSKYTKSIENTGILFRTRPSLT